MSFRVGQKVICVDAADTHTGDLSELIEGSIYTIRWHGPFEWRGVKENCVQLVEIVERPVMSGKKIVYSIDQPFRASRFRPVVERKTDTGMAILRQILRDHQQPIREQPARVTAPADHSPAPLS